MLLGEMYCAPAMSKDTNPVCALAIPQSSTPRQQINNSQKETAFAEACDPEKFFIPISISIFFHLRICCWFESEKRCSARTTSNDAQGRRTSPTADATCIELSAEGQQTHQGASLLPIQIFCSTILVDLNRIHAN